MSDLITTEQAQALLDGTTLGPWSVNPRASTNVESPSGRGVAAAGGYRDNISDGAYVAENDANARLIAAAPDAFRTVIALRAQLAAADKLATFPDEALLVELIRRNPPSKAPRSRTPHDQDSVIGIGKDHHCWITFQDEDLAAITAYKGAGK